MGFNAGLAGIRGSEKMVSEMMHSESEQILAMASFMRATGTHAALQRRDWTDFARRYNGAGFATNRSRPSTSLRPMALRLRADRSAASRCPALVVAGSSGT